MFFCLLIPHLWCNPTIAQNDESVCSEFDINFSGYIKDLPISIKQPSQQLQLGNFTRTRLKLDAEFKKTLLFTIHYELRSFQTESGLKVNLQSSNLFRPTYFHFSKNLINGENVRLDHTIDRMFLKYSAASFDLTIGRQRIAWGTGRVWNPTDLFNPFNPAAVDKEEKDGVDAITLQIPLGTLSNVTVVYAPLKASRESSTGARIHSNTEGYDFSVMGGYFNERVILGGDVAGSLGGAGIRGEATYTWEQSGIRNLNNRRFAKFIVGVDYQFSNSLYVIAEYHFNGEGHREPSQSERSRLFKGEIINLAQHYVFLSGGYPISPLLNITSNTILNLDDGSLVAGGLIDYWLFQNATVGVGVQYFTGSESSEFGSYPKIYYGKVQWFF